MGVVVGVMQVADKTVVGGIEAVEPTEAGRRFCGRRAAGAHPERIAMVHIDRPYLIVAQARRVFGVMAVASDCAGFSVEADQPSVRAHPERTSLVFQHDRDDVLGRVI